MLLSVLLCGRMMLISVNFVVFLSLILATSRFSFERRLLVLNVAVTGHCLQFLVTAYSSWSLLKFYNVNGNTESIK